VPVDKRRHDVAPAPIARLADNRERRREDIGQRERAISRHPRTIARESEQRAEFGVVNVNIGQAEQKNMLQGYIVDPETGKVVAVIRHGEVFREGKEGAKIATVLNANLYDLGGNLVGRLDGPHAIDVRTWSMPVAARNLLEGETAHRPVPAVQQKQRSESRPSHELAVESSRRADRGEPFAANSR
jgi:hypothetical protein